MDFGLSRCMDKITEVREILGTPEYVGESSFQLLKNQIHPCLFTWTDSSWLIGVHVFVLQHQRSWTMNPLALQQTCGKCATGVQTVSSHFKGCYADHQSTFKTVMSPLCEKDSLDCSPQDKLCFMSVVNYWLTQDNKCCFDEVHHKMDSDVTIKIDCFITLLPFRPRSLTGVLGSWPMSCWRVSLPSWVMTSSRHSSTSLKST